MTTDAIKDPTDPTELNEVEWIIANAIAEITTLGWESHTADARHIVDRLRGNGYVVAPKGSVSRTGEEE